MNTNSQIADLKRRLDNLLRVGTIAEVKKGFCRVKTGGLLTDWRPYFTHSAGKARTSWRPSLNEQVMLLSPSGDLACAYVLPALNSDEFDVPDDHPERNHTVYSDGAVIEYDPETSALKATGVKTALVKASEQVTVDCPNCTFTGNVLIKKKLTVKEGSDIDGEIKHQGKLTNTGGVSIDGIEFGTHKHPGVASGPAKTGNPE